jgi:hypothetical protein
VPMDGTFWGIAASQDGCQHQTVAIIRKTQLLPHFRKKAPAQPFQGTSARERTPLRLPPGIPVAALIITVWPLTAGWTRWFGTFASLCLSSV